MRLLNTVVVLGLFTCVISDSDDVIEEKTTLSPKIKNATNRKSTSLKEKLSIIQKLSRAFRYTIHEKKVVPQYRWLSEGPNGQSFVSRKTASTPKATTTTTTTTTTPSTTTTTTATTTTDKVTARKDVSLKQAIRLKHIASLAPYAIDVSLIARKMRPVKEIRLHDDFRLTPMNS